MFYSQISGANIYFDYNSSVDEIILQYYKRGFIYYPFFPFIMVLTGG